MKIAITKLRQNLFFTNDFSTPDLALYKINSILRNNDFESDVIDPFILQYKLKNKRIEDIFKNYDCVCISSHSIDWAINLRLINKIKKIFPNKIIIIGGIHVEYFPIHTLKVSRADIGFIGEAEYRLPKLIKAIKRNGNINDINGIVYKSDNKIVSTNKSKLLNIKNEYLDYDLYNDLPNCVYSTLPFESSRGCKGRCVFCSIKYKKNWREYRVEQTLKQLKKNIKYMKKLKRTSRFSKQIYFVDDCLTGDINHAFKLIKALINLNSNYKYAFEARVNDLIAEEKILEMLSHLNLQYIETGVESGYKEGIKKVRKGTSLKKVEKLAKLSKKYSINNKIKYSFIIGFPWETKNQCIKTIDFANRLVYKYGGLVSVGWYTLIPSYIYENREKYCIDRDASMYDKEYWFADENIFYETHYSLSKKDIEEIELYVSKLDNKNILSDNWKKARGINKNNINQTIIK